MSTIGKIFVVLNLVLAAAFVGWAYSAVSTSGEWKTKHQTLADASAKEKQTLDAELTKVRAELGLAQREYQSAKSAQDENKRAADRLQADKTELASNNASLQAAVTGIQTTLGEITASRDTAQANAAKALAAQNAAETARRAAEQAQEAAEKAMADAQSELRSAQAQIASLEKEKTKLVNESGSLRTSLDTIVKVTGADPKDFEDVPKIDGAVLGVDRSIPEGLVAINAGSTQGVRRGYTFSIYDGARYKGEVKVEFVHGDMSSGLITYTKPGETISQGDRATTRL